MAERAIFEASREHNFHGKLRLICLMRRVFRKISLSILHLLIPSEAWQAKVQPAMFSRRFAVSLFPASGNCSRPVADVDRAVLPGCNSLVFLAGMDHSSLVHPRRRTF